MPSWARVSWNMGIVILFSKWLEFFSGQEFGAVAVGDKSKAGLVREADVLDGNTEGSGFSDSRKKVGI